MNKEQHIVYLSLGTNLGDKFRNLQDALDEIALRVGAVEAVSSFIETEPLGFESENTFLNAVCRVKTPPTRRHRSRRGSSLLLRGIGDK